MKDAPRPFTYSEWEKKGEDYSHIWEEETKTAMILGAELTLERVRGYVKYAYMQGALHALEGSR